MKKQYHRMSKQSYSHTLSLMDGTSDSIVIGLYSDDGGCFGEFEIRWVRVTFVEIPKITIFDDAWQLFQEIPELFETLARRANMNITADDIEILLQSLGYEAVIK